MQSTFLISTGTSHTMPAPLKRSVARARYDVPHACAIAGCLRHFLSIQCHSGRRASYTAFWIDEARHANLHANLARRGAELSSSPSAMPKLAAVCGLSAAGAAPESFASAAILSASAV